MVDDMLVWGFIICGAVVMVDDMLVWGCILCGTVAMVDDIKSTLRRIRRGGIAASGTGPRNGPVSGSTCTPRWIRHGGGSRTRSELPPLRIHDLSYEHTKRVPA
ncbi:unnamed protein product [Boreogadus saida]